MPNKLDDLLHNYDGGGAHNVLDLVFKPCLSECKSYKRTAAEITAGAVANWGYAMLNIIDNHVPIEFLIGNNSEDFPLIKKINDLVDDEEKKRDAMQKFIQDKTRILFNLNIDQNVSTVIRSLYASGQLTMKAVFHLNDEGKIRLHHQKIGYFDCGENKGIIINGGGNESRNAYLENGENLSVRKEWHESHKEDFNFWKGILDGLEGHPKKLVVEPDRKFVDHLKSLSTLTSRNDLKNSWQRFLDSRDTGNSTPSPTPIPTSTPKPAPTPAPTPTPEPSLNADEFPEWFWKHQILAVKTYLENNQNKFSINEKLGAARSGLKGTLNMATGTGKTTVALEIARKMLLKEIVDKVIVFGDGTTDLQEQWKTEISNWRKSFKLKIKQYSTSREIDDFHIHDQAIISLRYDPPILNALLNPWVNNDGPKERLLIIFDEVHGYAVNQREQMELSLKDFPNTLGLSATPERGYDLEGDNYRQEEVGKDIFKFNLKEAISNGVLSPFNYHKITTPLGDGDSKKLQGIMASCEVNIKRDPLNKKQHIKERNIQMAKVYQLAENKPYTFEKYIEKNPESLKNCIIFCAEHAQGDEIAEIINNAKERPKFKIFYNQETKENKQKALDDLASGNIDLIIACISLSQGIDIKRLSRVFLLASWSELRQTIQRVGRCIRSERGRPDKVADIYDMLIKRPNGDTIKSDKDRSEFLTDIAKTKKNG